MNISVVIPCFNRQNILPRAIDSVIQQTIPVKEIIVVDDGSTDRTREVAEAMPGPIRVIHQQNSGASNARNRGIDAATGEWIAFLDSDDTWHPTKLAVQMQAAKACPNASLVFCDTTTVQSGKTVLESRFDLGGLYENATVLQGGWLHCDRRFFSIMLTQSRVITSAVMARRDLKNLRFDPTIWGSEDWALWLSLILDTEFVAVDKVLVTMQTSEDNLTHIRGRGRLLRNDVKVLQMLISDGRLTESERNHARTAVRQRRVAAVYHSLIRGEASEARRLLKDVTADDCNRLQRLKYQLLSRIPGPILKRLGNRPMTESAKELNENALGHAAKLTKRAILKTETST